MPPKWEVDPERHASELDVGYYGKLLGKAWDEVALFCSRFIGIQMDKTAFGSTIAIPAPIDNCFLPFAI
jgi:hypothetical protein